MRYFAVATLALFAAAAGIDAPSSKSEPEVIRFEWRPPGGPQAAYNLAAPDDQHQIVIFPGIEKGGKFPVVVGFHGQPKRGKPPREYRFIGVVKELVGQMIAKKEIQPVVLVLPVFRFRGQNWPQFDVRAFQAEIENKLKKKGLTASYWVAFGHSGAAGCGGDGLNRAHRFSSLKAVGFFDTCLGRGWREEIPRLSQKKIPTVNIHSVETAGFKPRQRPEYQSWFDFGRAFGPLGIDPIKCPRHHPGDKLRDQKYRCASTDDLIVKGFVVDTGEGADAHKALLPVALKYFLKEFVSRQH